MPKIACTKCKLFLRPSKNGVIVQESMPQLDESGEEKWVLYKLWLADRWVCRGCGYMVISGWGHDPLAEHYQKEEIERLKPSIEHVIDDC